MPFPDKVEIVIVDPKGKLGCRRATSGASHNAFHAETSGMVWQVSPKSRTANF